MKYILIFILALNSLPVFCQGGFELQSEKAKNEEVALISKAGVKTGSMFIYQYKTKLQSFEEEGRLVQIKEYDKDGYTTEKTSFFANASKSIVYKYGENHRLLEEESQMPKGVTSERKIYEFHKNGMLTGAKEYGKNGEIISTYSYIYDSNTRTENGLDSLGNFKSKEIIRSIPDSSKEETLLFNKKNVMYKKEIFIFNEDGREKRWTVVNTSFNQFSITEYVYEEELLTDIKYLDAYEVMRRYRENKYNEKNLIIESILYDQDGNPKDKTVYTYEYY